MVRDVHADPAAAEDGSGVLREFLRPALPVAKARLAGISCDAEDTIDGKDLPGRRRNIAFKRLELALEPLARLVGMAAAGKPELVFLCLLYTSPSPRDRTSFRMPSSA